MKALSVIAALFLSASAFANEPAAPATAEAPAAAATAPAAATAGTGQQHDAGQTVAKKKKKGAKAGKRHASRARSHNRKRH